MKLLSILFISNFLLLVSPDILPQSLENQIDRILNKKYKPDAPGAVFMIAKGGVPVYRKAFGQANMELKVDMNPENVFQIGSMNKQFTAVAILMLAEEGKLNVSDKITKYIPDYPVHGKTITIHHLLTHTSGIKDYTSMRSLRDIAQKNLSPKELVDFFKDEPMDFDPGEKFQYNNSGYVLLGYIIELVSGMSYEDFIGKNIFQKVGMENSRYASDREIIKNRAYGYQQNSKGYINKMPISYTVSYAAGSLMSTVDDMLKWQESLNHNVLISEKTIKKAFANYTLNNGENIAYGYGWHLREINGFPDYEHGGSIFGYKSMGVYIPEKDIYVIGLSNCDCNSPTQVTRDIAAIASEYF